jgi:hypothetical protein
VFYLYFLEVSFSIIKYIFAFCLVDKKDIKYF